MLLHVRLEEQQRIRVHRRIVVEVEDLLSGVGKIEAVGQRVQPSTDPMELIGVRKLRVLAILRADDLEQRRPGPIGIGVSQSGPGKNGLAFRFVSPRIGQRGPSAFRAQLSILEFGLPPPAWRVATTVGNVGHSRMHARMHARDTALVLTASGQQRLACQSLDGYRRGEHGTALADALEQRTPTSQRAGRERLLRS